MMSGARLEAMFAARARYSACRPGNDRRTFIVRLEGIDLARRAGLARIPGLLKGGLVALRMVGAQKGAILLDEIRDEIARGRYEDGLAFLRIGGEQIGPAPSLQRR